LCSRPKIPNPSSKTITPFNASNIATARRPRTLARSSTACGRGRRRLTREIGMLDCWHKSSPNYHALPGSISGKGASAARAISRRRRKLLHN
jgi:hypothetical protein